MNVAVISCTSIDVANNFLKDMIGNMKYKDVDFAFFGMRSQGVYSADLKNGDKYDAYFIPDVETFRELNLSAIVNRAYFGLEGLSENLFLEISRSPIVATAVFMEL